MLAVNIVLAPNTVRVRNYFISPFGLTKKKKPNFFGNFVGISILTPHSWFFCIRFYFCSDFCSELEEVYEQLSKWLEDPLATDENREMDARDRAVVQFAGSLLRRALSESFAGVPVQEGEPQPLTATNDVHQKHKLALAVRSLSLELARQRNRRQQSVSNVFSLPFNFFFLNSVPTDPRKRLRASRKIE